jgi:excisionase family DNA binding protein
MAEPNPTSGQTTPFEDVLTLSEAAAYLRVSADALSDLAANRGVPAQKIGGEWRFLKRALADWLRYGPGYVRDAQRLFPWVWEGPPMERLLEALEARLLQKLASEEQSPAGRGSKQAVLRHFGVWQDDPAVGPMLEEIYARRRAKTEGEE